MIEIKDKRRCTGCGLCVSVCPMTAIGMDEDEEGFRYPRIDIVKCIGCNKCEKFCPMTNEERTVPQENMNSQPIFLAGQLKDAEALSEVSSGGAFWALAQAILDQNGIIYGAVQSNVDYIYHVRVADLQEAKKMRRSKYFQSDVGECYRLAQNDLKEGKIVLFSGTACQIAALNSYLNRSYDNLFTCDVVCHGVPSMKVWRAYRREYENKTGKKIVQLVFRDKSSGWSKNQYLITHEDGSIMRQRSTQHLFHAGYLQGLFYRPSCGSCNFSKIPRVSDITLADFWRYTGKFHGKKHDFGVSLISVNNKHGLKLIGAAEKYLSLENTTRELALSSCKHLHENPSENANRKAFFEEFNKNGYFAAAEKYITIDKPKSIFAKVCKKIKRIMRYK